MPKAFKKDPKVSIPKGGEAVKGKAIFEAQCATCHAIEQVNYCSILYAQDEVLFFSKWLIY